MPEPAPPHHVASPATANASELLAHERGRVCGFANECYAQKFMCMGVRPGSEVELVRKAAWGQACYFDIDGRKLAVRREEAACLLIQRMADAM